MLIRKLFKFEGSHIVRDCTSKRCSRSIHGHSYVVEIFFTARGLDNGQMLMDFGLMKGTIKDFIDSFDHTHVMWEREKEEDKLYFDRYERKIVLPCSPSAEMLSLMFFYVIGRIVCNTEFNNGEKGVILQSVRVHETETGWAESFEEDLVHWHWNLRDIQISQPIKDDWTNPDMISDLIKTKPFINPTVNLKFQ